MYASFILYTYKYFAQCRRKLRSNPDDKSGAQVHGRSVVDAAGHLQVLLRNQRPILSVRRAKLLHDVRFVDLQRSPGNHHLQYILTAFTRCEINAVCFFPYIFHFLFSSIRTGGPEAHRSVSREEPRGRRHRSDRILFVR